MSERSYSRRRFLSTLAAAALAPLAGLPAPLRARMPTMAAGDHPDPRPDVDASRVLPSDQVAPHAAELFDRVREIPHIVDGLRCACGCADLPDMRSLLSCYEGVGMAQYCDICSGEGRLAARLHAEGRTLAEIRAAVDQRYG